MIPIQKGIVLWMCLLMVVGCMAYELTPHHTYEGGGSGTYSVSLTDPDTVRVKSVVTGIGDSEGHGYVASDQATFEENPACKIRAAVHLYVHFTLCKEYADDVAEVNYFLALYRGAGKVVDGFWRQDSDYDGTIWLYTGYGDCVWPGTFSHTCYFGTQAYSEGVHSGSYSTSNSYDSGQKVQVLKFYIFVE